MIERIRIRNYRSLHDVEVRLEPLTVLVGRSGSGKSNFVRAVRLLRDVVGGRNPELVWANRPFGSSEGLGYDLAISVRGVDLLGYSVQFAPQQHGPVVDEKLTVGSRVVFHQAGGRWLVDPGVDPKPNPGHLALGQLTGVREATVAYVAVTRGIGCYDFPGTVLQNNSPLEQGPGYSGEGDSHQTVAGRVLDAIDRLGDWAAVSKSLTALNPRLATLDLVLPKRDQLRVGYRVDGDRTHMVDVAQESEGFRRYLAHLLALYQTPPKQTMLFEHPENGIHPGALEALFDEFRSHVEQGRGQVVLTTHSPQLLDHFQPGQLRVVAMDGSRTRIGPLASEQIDVVRKRLMTAGELLTVDPARIDTPAGVGA